MQDSVFSVIHRKRPLNDIVDEEWVDDCLSDDGLDPTSPTLTHPILRVIKTFPACRYRYSPGIAEYGR